MGSGILIVANRRSLRRELFNALDRAGCQQIHSACDAAHAATLLAGRPELGLVLVGLGGDRRRANEVVAALRALAPAARAPLLVVLADGCGLEPGGLPAGIAGWMFASRAAAELTLRWRGLLDAADAGTDLEPALAPVPAGSGAGPGAPVGLDAGAALALVTRLVGQGGGRGAVAGLLFDGLNLDYLALWSAPRGMQHHPVQLLQQVRGEVPADWPEAGVQLSLRRVLAGHEVAWHGAAQAAPAIDPVVTAFGLAELIGLPLRDEHGNVLGALLAGSRSARAASLATDAVLRTAALRFAQAMELATTQERERAEGLLDSLTGLPNRLLFHDRLETIIREAVRNGENFALLLVDLDRFHVVNDSFGHEAGDQVLRVATRRLGDSIRASDTLARRGGDEFIVVLRNVVRHDDVLRVAEKIVRELQAPVWLDEGLEIQVTASLGVSCFPDDAGDAMALLQHAEEAARAAKRRGRNTFQVYEVSPEYARAHGTALRASLRHAEANGELRVVYQPQVDAQSEDIVGMEALVRWEHPELGTVSPGVFVPLAEETGLIGAIGEWVLRTACRQAREWERRYALHLRLGVNLSAVQLMDPGLVDLVAGVLRDTGFDPTLLELEVTESISIKAVPNLVDNLNALHRLGCHVAIDDFGTGAASLDYLRRLPADRIKIDQSFVRNIGVDPDDEAIVRATLEMAHRLKRTVIAEGAENERHLAFLRQHGCEELQGYLFCRPLAEDAFGHLLAERERLVSGAVGELA